MTTLRNVWHTVIGRVDFVDPPIAQFLFASPYASVLWLAARLYLGWKWLGSGIDKLGNSAWMDTGAAVQGFWARAVVVPETGRPVVTYDWYRDFLQFMLDGGGALRVVRQAHRHRRGRHRGRPGSGLVRWHLGVRGARS